MNWHAVEMAKRNTAINPKQGQGSSRTRAVIMSAATAGALLVGGLFLVIRDDSQQVELATVLAQVRSGKVWSAKLIEAERRVETTTVDKKHFHAYWDEAGDQREALAKELMAAQPPGGYSVEVPLN
ncbi:hypothetical protein ACFV1N_13765 [Streptosporangium canum]|uniref:hypothetical protein n=1 Tax=Streptosporangium canum TaxID=324952 RepID=UPI0036B6CCC9